MSRVDRITSPANPLLRDIRRAVSRGDVVGDGLWIAEGFHLLEEALHSQLASPVILTAEAHGARVERMVGEFPDARIILLPNDLFPTIAATESSQGVMTLVRPPCWTLEQIFDGHSLVLVLDGLQDPGNAGAAVRTAEAFGATGIIFVKNSASPSNPKTLRASAGSLFRVPFITGLEADAVATALQQHRLSIYAAMPWTGSEHIASDVDFTRRVALIVGSEGRGISEALLKVAGGVAIPTTGVESLNAATAAAILLYEARRQRTHAGAPA